MGGCEKDCKPKGETRGLSEVLSQHMNGRNEKNHE